MQKVRSWSASLSAISQQRPVNASPSFTILPSLPPLIPLSPCSQTFLSAYVVATILAIYLAVHCTLPRVPSARPLDAPRLSLSRPSPDLLLFTFSRFPFHPSDLAVLKASFSPKFIQDLMTDLAWAGGTPERLFTPALGSSTNQLAKLESSAPFARRLRPSPSIDEVPSVPTPTTRDYNTRVWGHDSWLDFRLDRSSPLTFDEFRFGALAWTRAARVMLESQPLPVRADAMARLHLLWQKAIVMATNRPSDCDSLWPFVSPMFAASNSQNDRPVSLFASPQLLIDTVCRVTLGVPSPGGEVVELPSSVTSPMDRFCYALRAAGFTQLRIDQLLVNGPGLDENFFSDLALTYRPATGSCLPHGPVYEEFVSPSVSASDFKEHFPNLPSEVSPDKFDLNSFYQVKPVLADASFVVQGPAWASHGLREFLFFAEHQRAPKPHDSAPLRSMFVASELMDTLGFLSNSASVPRPPSANVNNSSHQGDGQPPPPGGPPGGAPQQSPRVDKGKDRALLPPNAGESSENDQSQGGSDTQMEEDVSMTSKPISTTQSSSTSKAGKTPVTPSSSPRKRRSSGSPEPRTPQRLRPSQALVPLLTPSPSPSRSSASSVVVSSRARTWRPWQMVSRDTLWPREPFEPTTRILQFGPQLSSPSPTRSSFEVPITPSAMIEPLDDSPSPSETGAQEEEDNSFPTLVELDDNLDTGGVDTERIEDDLEGSEHSSEDGSEISDHSSEGSHNSLFDGDSNPDQDCPAVQVSHYHGKEQQEYPMARGFDCCGCIEFGPNNPDDYVPPRNETPLPADRSQCRLVFPTSKIGGLSNFSQRNCHCSGTARCSLCTSLFGERPVIMKVFPEFEENLNRSSRWNADLSLTLQFIGVAFAYPESPHLWPVLAGYCPDSLSLDLEALPLAGSPSAQGSDLFRPIPLSTLCGGDGGDAAYCATDISGAMTGGSRDEMRYAAHRPLSNAERLQAPSLAALSAGAVTGDYRSPPSPLMPSVVFPGQTCWLVPPSSSSGQSPALRKVKPGFVLLSAPFGCTPCAHREQWCVRRLSDILFPSGQAPAASTCRCCTGPIAKRCDSSPTKGRGVARARYFARLIFRLALHFNAHPRLSSDDRRVIQQWIALLQALLGRKPSEALTPSPAGFYIELPPLPAQASPAFVREHEAWPKAPWLAPDFSQSDPLPGYLSQSSWEDWGSGIGAERLLDHFDEAGLLSSRESFSTPEAATLPVNSASSVRYSSPIRTTVPRSRSSSLHNPVPS